MARIYSKENIKIINSYLDSDLSGVLGDKTDFLVSKDVMSTLSNNAFLYKDVSGELCLCFLGRTRCIYEICITSCPLKKLHTITVEIEVGSDGTKTIASEKHHFGLSLDGIVTVSEKTYDELISNLSVGIPFDGKMPIKIIDAKDAELAADGNINAIDRIFKAATEISNISP